MRRCPGSRRAVDDNALWPATRHKQPLDFQSEEGAPVASFVAERMVGAGVRVEGGMQGAAGAVFRRFVVRFHASTIPRHDSIIRGESNTESEFRPFRRREKRGAIFGESSFDDQNGPRLCESRKNQ